MTVKGTQDLKRFATTLRGVPTDFVRREGRMFLDDLAEQNVDDQKNVIATTPSGLSPGKPDRIWTGDMHDAVDRTGVDSNKGRASVRVGWVKTLEDYFKFQETGQGMGRPSIPPMMMRLRGMIAAQEFTQSHFSDYFQMYMTRKGPLG